MSLNKASRKQCQRDHECCIEHDRLKRQIDILQGKLKNIKQDLSLAERVNIRLLEHTQGDKPMGRTLSLYGLTATTTDRQSTTDRLSLPQYEVVKAAERQAFEEQLRKAQDDYDRKIRHMQMQVQRINEDAKGRAMITEHKYQLQLEVFQQKEWQIKGYINQMELEVKNLRGIIHGLEKDKQIIINERQNESNKVFDLERTNKSLEAECVSVRLQMTHLKDSMKELESSYQDMNKQFLLERQLSRQLMMDSKTKQEQLAYAKTQLRINTEGKDRLFTRKEQLECMIDHLEEYAFDARKRENQVRRKLVSAHEPSLKKVRSIAELRSDRFKYV